MRRRTPPGLTGERPAPRVAGAGRHRRAVPRRSRAQAGLAARACRSSTHDAMAALTDAKPAFEKAWEQWDRHRERRDAARRLPRRPRHLGRRSCCATSSAGGTATYRLPGAALADAAQGVRSPNHAVTVTATGALVHGDAVGALVLVVDPVDSLRDRSTTAGRPARSTAWRSCCAARRARSGSSPTAAGGPRQRPPTDTMVASGIVDAQTWVEEPQTAQRLRRAAQPHAACVGGKPEDRLTELFGESVAAAEEITEALGVQVRRAVELLVQALSEAALDAARPRRADPLPADRDAGLRGGRHGDDARGVPALRRGARPAAAGPAVRDGLRHQRRAGRARPPGPRGGRRGPRRART